MDKFNETMAIGAASGDTSAAWDVYAKEHCRFGDKAPIDAVSQMDANGQLGEEFSAALEACNNFCYRRTSGTGEI